MSPNEFLLVWASELGNTESVAKVLAESAKEQGLTAQIFSASDFAKIKWEEERVAVFLSSTTGDGDPPEHSTKFHRFLKRHEDKDFLRNLSIAVAGFGDSNYDNFCQGGKLLEKNLRSRGAKPILKLCECDEVDGNENFEPWMKSLWPALKEHLQKAAAEEKPTEAAVPKTESSAAPKAPESNAGAAPQPKKAYTPMARLVPVEWDLVGAQDADSGALEGPSEEDEAGASAKNPFFAKIKGYRKLTTEDSHNAVYDLELGIEGMNANFVPGSWLGIVPENDGGDVDALLRLLDWDGSKRIEGVRRKEGSKGGVPLGHIKFPCTVKEALTKHCEIASAPSKIFLRRLVEYTSDPEEKDKLLYYCSREGRSEFTTATAGMQIRDVFRRFKSCKPPLEVVLDSIPPLAGRAYSSCSSPLVKKDSVHIAFSVVRRDYAGEKRMGVCTGWLQKLILSGSMETIPIYRGPANTPFRMPEDLSIPTIMVGPGTGVAPFLGMLHHRSVLLESDSSGKGVPHMLFFGCRDEKKNFLYREELQKFEADGILTELVTAFSGANVEKKVYVQHKLIERASEIHDLITSKNATVLVCGSMAMMKDVNNALLEIFKSSGGLQEADAKLLLTQLTTSKRYLREAWG